MMHTEKGGCEGKGGRGGREAERMFRGDHKVARTMKREMGGP